MYMYVIPPLHPYKKKQGLGRLLRRLRRRYPHSLIIYGEGDDQGPVLFVWVRGGITYMYMDNHIVSQERE